MQPYCVSISNFAMCSCIFEGRAFTITKCWAGLNCIYFHMFLSYNIGNENNQTIMAYFVSRASMMKERYDVDRY